MKIPYRTRVTLSRVGLVVGTVAAFAALAWFCWVVWLGRYVVYGRDGQATLDFDLPEQAQTGEIASPPAADANVSIYYNEGADAVDNTGTLTQLNGYYNNRISFIPPLNISLEDIDLIFQAVDSVLTEMGK